MKIQSLSPGKIDEHLYPDLEDKIDDIPEAYNLSFFHGNREIIVSIINEQQKIRASRNNLNNTNNDISFQSNTPGPKWEPKRPTESSFNDTLKQHSNIDTGRIHQTNISNDKSNEIGKHSEAIVLKDLKNQGKEPVAISGYSHNAKRSDSLHYDIRFTENDETFYVEVKSATNNRIFISREEIVFAINNAEHYILALVRNDTPYYMNDFGTKLKRLVDKTPEILQWDVFEVANWELRFDANILT